jgi:L-fuconolactonase
MSTETAEPLIDTHVHLVSDDAVRFPRQINASATHPWWAGGDHDLGAFRREMTVHGVAAALIVQAVGVYGYDNSYVQETTNGAAALAGVAALDMEGDGVGDEMTRLARAGGVAGVRLFGVSPGSSWIGSGKVDEAFTAADRSGVPLVLTVFEHQLPALIPPITRFPGLRLALDHCAFAAVDGGRVHDQSPLLDLVDIAHVTLKVSSHTLLDVPSPHAPSELVDDLLSRFGPARLMWGSDWPQTPLANYAAHLELAGRAFGHLPAGVRTQIFGQNALAWLGDRSLTIVAGAGVDEAGGAP